MWTGISFILRLQDIRLGAPDAVNSFFEIVSMPQVYLSAILIAIFAVLWFSDRDKGEFMLFTFLSAICVSNIMKVTVKQPRPWILDSSVEPDGGAMKHTNGYSLPSGHTVASVAGYGSLFRYVGILWKIVIAVFVFLVIFSRMYLGVHTPLDIIVGIVTGIAMITVNIFLMKISAKDEHYFTAVRLIYAAIAVAALIVISVTDTLTVNQSVVIGSLIGASLGSVLEHKFVNYTVREFTVGKLCICLLSLIPIAAIFAAGYSFGTVSALFSAAIVMLTAVSGVPYVLKFFSK